MSTSCWKYRRAIVVPYVVEQNCPSGPLPEIYDIPKDVDECKEMLSSLYVKIFGAEDDVAEDGVVITTYQKSNYGNMSITSDHERYLYITFI